MPWTEESAAWVVLSRAPALKPATVRRAIELFGHAHALIEACRSFGSRAFIPDAARLFLASADARLSQAEQRWLDAPNHHVLPFCDARYPALLRAGGGHPLLLYVSGDPGALSAPQLAVVGSRNPTAQGQDNAHHFSRYLAERGLAITSGLAAGIDAAAHRGALAASGRTLGVLGSGIDVIYPHVHRGLAHEIEASGALVSGFPLGTAPRRPLFAQRNATIAGLSLATLVVEAAESSGSLITARMARRRGRVLFAIPGSIGNPLCRGCHALIREGATLADSPHDICRELDLAAPSCAAGRGKEAAGDAGFSAAGMDKGHKILLDALGFDPVDLDLLVRRTGLKPEAVSSMMLILELEGHVQAAPGGRYSRVVRSRR